MVPFCIRSSPCWRPSRHLRANVERFIQPLKHECYDKFAIVAERHLNHVNREWLLHYNLEGPHEGRGHLLPDCDMPPEPSASIQKRDVVCMTRFDGSLKSYSRRAA